MRIISGKCKGRKLSIISGRDIRPTSDRIREAIFNIIAEKIKGAAILDLFAGTGALWLEALSLGADHGFFIDISDYALNIVKNNIIKCNFNNNTTVIHQDILQSDCHFTQVDGKPDIVFMDPPYNCGLVEKALLQLGLLELLSDSALIIAEHSEKEKITGPFSGFDIVDQRKYGRTLVSFFEKRESQKAFYNGHEAELD